MTKSPVLVLTQRFDPTADLVIRGLNSRRVPAVRLDVAEFPETPVLQGRIGGGRNDWNGLLSTDHHTVCLADIRSIWYRRPTRFILHPAMPASDRAWAEREALAGFGGVLSALRCRWVNHPHRNAIAESKPLQLATAVACGLPIPDTLFEVRLIVVGQQQFAARIDASSDKARVDWRSDYGSLTYQPATVPQSISDGVNQLMTSLGLAYGALDFIVDPEGCWYFLEVNPNGQWGWIELATDLPIAHAIADLLEGWTP